MKCKNRANLLSGTLPEFSSFPNLNVVGLSNNQFSGGIPALTGLAELNTFQVANNRLTGPLPALTGLSSLVVFTVGINQLSGPLPEPPSPSALAPGGSNLCPNAFPSTTFVSHPAWDVATASNPWFRSCVIFFDGFE